MRHDGRSRVARDSAGAGLPRVLGVLCVLGALAPPSAQQAPSTAPALPDVGRSDVDRRRGRGRSGQAAPEPRACRLHRAGRRQSPHRRERGMGAARGRATDDEGAGARARRLQLERERDRRPSHRHRGRRASHPARRRPGGPRRGQCLHRSPVAVGSDRRGEPGPRQLGDPLHCRSRPREGRRSAGWPVSGTR